MLIAIEIKTKRLEHLHNYGFEFHIAKEIRKKYVLEDKLFSLSGNVIFADFAAVRVFVQKINNHRNEENKLRFGEVNAAGLIDEIYHFILRQYEETENNGVFAAALNHLNITIGEEETRKILFNFIELFPPMDVFKGRSSSFDYLNSFTEDKSNREIVLEELMLLYFANYNPANIRLKELFDENYFSDKSLYDNAIEELGKFFKTQKSFGPDNQDIFNLLFSPIQASPGNLWDQLEYMQNRWEIILKDKFSSKILRSKDLMKEDTRFDIFFTGGGAPPTVTPVYKGKVFGAEHLILGKSMYKYADDAEKDYDEPENFTPDIHWMPNVVMIAKNSYVWLDQLSNKFGREIRTLDQVPDEELDRLAKWNFNALWLIGIWERSSASKKIKHIMGNIDAVASAYSLYDYQIAHDLGGESAYINLNERCKERGIRLASDMVPNHTGIYSDWIINHPDYFIQANQPPFPNYTFNGEDLSPDRNIEIKIEDGYWRRSDAAVVFRRIDKRYNDTRYIYHGNDGTNMPWNDTAQLDMLKKEVRDAVVQKIFEVARRFSIIRFDAAMTLTKRHFSRLWYPQPGKGGDIPSRTDYSLTREQFDNLFPEEFWREVVDRMNKEMPETLLLAEAFWLMEGYFVRSLGMHRVYNSAFMHMMMKEENDKYRDLITNTLEFEPEILKRYVNFMSNPDEETAIRQFGTDDKYFGVLTLMVTLPGLPMFAHGQIEGFTEKYGMEYQRAYYNEQPKEWLVTRHEREIFPLMRKRYLFAEVENFWFYDCLDNSGNINENVFAFTNSLNNEKALVLYNNCYEKSFCKIFYSTPKLKAEGETKNPVKTSLTEALGIKNDSKYFYKAFNQIDHLEYLFRGSQFFNGFYFEMKGFEHFVYLGFKEVYDVTGDYEELFNNLSGKGVQSIEHEKRELKLKPIHNAFVDLFNEHTIKLLVEEIINNDNEKKIESGQKNAVNRYKTLLHEINNQFPIENEKEFSETLSENIKKAISLNLFLAESIDMDNNSSAEKLMKSVVISAGNNYREDIIVLLLYFVLNNLQSALKKNNIDAENLLLFTPIKKSIIKLGRGEEGINREYALINTLLEFEKQYHLNKARARKNTKIGNSGEQPKQNAYLTNLTESIINLLEDEYCKSFILVNYYEDIAYYSKERFEELVDWLFTLVLIDSATIKISSVSGESETEKMNVSDIRLLFNYLLELKSLSEMSSYKLENLKTKLLILADQKKSAF